MTAPQVYDIPLRDISIDENNIRHSGAENDLQELADSIKKHGLLQLIVLRGTHGKPPYKLIIGQRRFLAHKKILNAKTIQATFSGQLSDTEAAVRSLAENMCRIELSYSDAADAITGLYKHFGRDARRVAKETGLSIKKINQYIYIEERASDRTKKLLREKKVRPVDVQRAIRAASEDINKADQLIDLMREYELTPPAMARMVEYGREHPSAKAKDIIEKAQEPVVERQVLVHLTEQTRRALVSAATTLRMDPDAVAARAVEEWLSSKGFLK
jgi:ParB family chromosome partitioning protein